jgi:hypothetical protein
MDGRMNDQRKDYKLCTSHLYLRFPIMTTVPVNSCDYPCFLYFASQARRIPVSSCSSHLEIRFHSRATVPISSHTPLHQLEFQSEGTVSISSYSSPLWLQFTSLATVLCAFAKLWKATIMSVRPSVRLSENLYTFVIIRCWIILRMRNFSDKTCRENKTVHFLFNNLFLKLCLLWDSVKKYVRDRQATDDNIIRRMRFKC